MNGSRQSQLCVDQQSICKVRVTGDVKIERVSLHQMPVQHNAHTAIIAWRHGANEQKAKLQPHRSNSSVSLAQKIGVAAALHMSSYFRCSGKQCTPLKVACLTDGDSSLSTATK